MNIDEAGSNNLPRRIDLFTTASFAEIPDRGYVPCSDPHVGLLPRRSGPVNHRTAANQQIKFHVTVP